MFLTKMLLSIPNKSTSETFVLVVVCISTCPRPGCSSKQSLTACVRVAGADHLLGMPLILC